MDVTISTPLLCIMVMACMQKCISFFKCSTKHRCSTLIPECKVKTLERKKILFQLLLRVPSGKMLPTQASSAAPYCWNNLLPTSLALNLYHLLNIILRPF